MSGAVLSDIGFADARAARLVIRRLKMRAALNDAQVSIEALLDLLDRRIEADGNAASALLDEVRNLAPHDLPHFPPRTVVFPVGSNDVREKELLEGIDMVLELLDTLGVGIRHGLFSADHQQGSKPASPINHSLSGDAK